MNDIDVRPFSTLGADRSVRFAAAAHALLAVGLCFAPLTAVLGFERALATALLSTVTAPWLGMRAAKGALEKGEPLHWWAAAVVLGGLLLLPSLLLGAFYEWVTLACDQRAGLELHVLLGGGNVAFGTALGFAARALLGVGPVKLTRPATWAALAVLLIDLAWLGAALVRLYREPQIFMFVQPFGWWPGSLYDEALTVSPALVGFRGVGALMSMVLVLGTRAVLKPGRGRGFAWSPAVVAVAAAGLAAVLSSHGEALGFDRDRASVIEALSQTVETEHFVLRAAPSVPREQVEALARDHEFRWHQLHRFFGVAPRGRITSFVYANSAEKGRLIGAERTQIARPWVNEIHLNGAAVPHRVMKHELAHIFAGALAPTFFRIPLISGLVPNIGLIEGVAVAADAPVRELTVHQWAAAMLRLERLPSVSRSLAPTGFWSLSSSRAYVAFGSFVGWLVETRGIEAFTKVYAGGRFSAAYGESAATLEEQWRAFLESVTLEPVALRLAEHRFSRPSIFEKVCARSTAELAQRGYGLLRSRDLSGAAPILRHVWSLQPSDPTPLLALARAQSRAGDLEAAEKTADEASRAPGATEASRLLAREIIGEIERRRGRWDAARRIFNTVRDAGLSSASRRLQSVRLALLGKPLADVVLPYLAGEWSPEQALVRLGELHRNAPDATVLGYLYARRLEAARLSEEGLAIALDLPLERLEAPELRAEARLLAGRLAQGAGRFLLAQDLFSAALRAADRPAVAAEAGDWLERARFEYERNREMTGARSGD